MMMRFLSIALLTISAGPMAMAEDKPAAPRPCEPHPECVLSSSRLVPAAPNSGIRTQQQPSIATDKGLVVQGISPLDRSTFRVPSLGKGGIP